MNTLIPSAASTEDLVRSLSRMVDEAEQFLEVAAQSGDQKLDAARDKLVKNVHRMRTQLESLEEDALRGARHAARAANNAAQEHPYTAIGIAVGVVLLIGALATRRWP